MKTETIILSIHPRHVEKILTGEKKYEYRKRIPDGVRYIIVYATYPVKKIMALIEVESVLQNTPSFIWLMTKEYAGISHQFFLKYFENKTVSYAVKFKHVFKVEPSLPIDIFGYSNGPQSYIYLNWSLCNIKSILQIKEDNSL